MTDPFPDFDHLLGPEGPIARALGEYEPRSAQIEMARVVWRAITQNIDALIEAGTGTGKSIAYLLPILLSERKLIISTANKALQSQLHDKDVPLVRQALGLDFEAVLIKGRQNYVCWRKYQLELPQQRAFAQIDGRQVYDLDELDNWVRGTETGDLEDLPFVLDTDTLSHITCPTDECLHRDCLYYDRCFVMLVRQRAAEARVVITNHHLLITDLYLRTIGGVSLPDTDLIVCDEAHQIEDVATSIFETAVTDYTIPRLLQRHLIRANVPPKAAEDLAAQNRLFFEGVRAYMQESTVKLTGDWEEGIRLGHAARDLAEELGKLDPYGEDPDKDQENTSFGLAVQALRTAGENILRVSRSNHDDQVVRFAEQTRQRHVNLTLHATPISASEPLGKHLFAENTVVCTSATLATGASFDLFKARCGIVQQPLELIGDPVFDFAHQALVYLPELRAYDWQNKEHYFDAVAQETMRLLEVSRGRAFCLFTSWAGMTHVASSLRDQLPWPVLVQGELPRSELLRLFKDTPYSVLFATRSFWEGVDVPGDALSLVIIDKLPFPSPRDPLHEARTERIAENGGNPFSEYTLPMMILALKQGFGRLIRSKTDRGIVAILDNRLTTKQYGSTVLRSLPPAQVTRRFGDVHQFYSSQFGADYALTVSTQSGEQGSVPYRWQLVRLPDGRAKGGQGVDVSAESAQWTAVQSGVQQLAHAIQKGNRSIQDFGIEIRLLGISANNAVPMDAAPAPLRERLSTFSSVRVIALPGKNLP